MINGYYSVFIFSNINIVSNISFSENNMAFSPGNLFSDTNVNEQRTTTIRLNIFVSLWVTHRGFLNLIEPAIHFYRFLSRSVGVDLPILRKHEDDERKFPDYFGIFQSIFRKPEIFSHLGRLVYF